MTTDLEERLRQAAAALDEAADRHAAAPLAFIEPLRRRGPVIAIGMVTASLAVGGAFVLTQRGQSPLVTVGAPDATSPTSAAGATGVVACIAQQVELRAFADTVAAAQARLWQPATRVSSTTSRFDSGYALAGRTPTLYEVSLDDAGAVLSVAATTGLDTEAITRDRTAPVTETPEGRTMMIGTDGADARAIELTADGLIYYARSESSDGSTIRSLEDLRSLLTAIADERPTLSGGNPCSDETGGVVTAPGSIAP